MDYEGKIYGSGATIEKLDAHRRYADAYTTALVETYARRMQGAFAEVVDPQRTLGSADDGSLFTMLFGASNPAGAQVAARMATGVFSAATGDQGRMRLER